MLQCVDPMNACFCIQICEGDEWTSDTTKNTAMSTTTTTIPSSKSTNEKTQIEICLFDSNKSPSSSSKYRRKQNNHQYAVLVRGSNDPSSLESVIALPNGQRHEHDHVNRGHHQRRWDPRKRQFRAAKQTKKQQIAPLEQQQQQQPVQQPTPTDRHGKFRNRFADQFRRKSPISRHRKTFRDHDYRKHQQPEMLLEEPQPLDQVSPSPVSNEQNKPHPRTTTKSLLRRLSINNNNKDHDQRTGDDTKVCKTSPIVDASRHNSTNDQDCDPCIDGGGGRRANARHHHCTMFSHRQQRVGSTSSYYSTHSTSAESAKRVVQTWHAAPVQARRPSAVSQHSAFQPKQNE